MLCPDAGEIPFQFSSPHFISLRESSQPFFLFTGQARLIYVSGDHVAFPGKAFTPEPTRETAYYVCVGNDGATPLQAATPELTTAGWD